jgi:hypothetical protein
MVLDDESGKWERKTFHLVFARNKKTLQDIANIAGRVIRKNMRVKIVERDEYVEFYVGRGRDRVAVEWWSSTYGAMEKGSV